MIELAKKTTTLAISKGNQSSAIDTGSIEKFLSCVTLSVPEFRTKEKPCTAWESVQGLYFSKGSQIRSVNDLFAADRHGFKD